MTTKAEIRSRMKSERSLIGEQKRLEWNEAIFRRVIETKEYKTSGVLLGYASFGAETDTEAILAHAQKLQKRVYLPRVESRERMEFYLFPEGAQLCVSRFGVPEPVPDTAMDTAMRYTPEEAPQERPVMLMPGLAFDPMGNRIGYGAGYYDKYLADFPEDYFFKIGICYDFQLLEHIPSGPHDIRADMVITPAGSRLR
ncbi:5-formyltetrahydrofolate cyclo-ligase [Anaerotaenia torta]|uniref:5-formyltetrahydrofolate cyclo-ligase n=1 Tax=Anaerotaenia torta TaxID=433293 RepID=UPI003D196C14